MHLATVTATANLGKQEQDGCMQSDAGNNRGAIWIRDNAQHETSIPSLRHREPFEIVI